MDISSYAGWHWLYGMMVVMVMVMVMNFIYPYFSSSGTGH